MIGADRDRIAALMACMARGDHGSSFAMYDEFGGVLRSVMRRHLREVGVAQVAPDDLDGVALDACLALVECASAWRADGGALPWTWAHHRLRAIAARFVGIHADDLDAEVLDHLDRGAEPACGRAGDDEPALADLLASLAERHPQAALLVDAFDLVGSPRDQEIVLELAVQALLGDPSPSHTVGIDHDLTPDAVRQVGSRLRRRLRELAATDQRYAALADVALVA